MIASSLLASGGGDRVAVIVGLEPAFPAARAFGRAFTAQGARGDNLALHHAVAHARAGDVIVLAVGEEQDVAHCGEIVALAARERGIAGIVIDGAIRDRVEITELGLPVFHLGTSPSGPGKAGPGTLGVPIELRGVRVEAGDLISADADGIAVVRAVDVESVTAAAEALVAREQEIIARIRGGESTVDIFGLKELG